MEVFLKVKLKFQYFYVNIGWTKHIKESFVSKDIKQKCIS